MCGKQISKKYTSRSSPPYPANKCCGKQKKGNDGKMYISISDKNGRCRWVLKGLKRRSSQTRQNSKRWVTHDNGGRPFLVVSNGKTIKVYKATENEPNYTKLVKKYNNVEKIFIGKSPRNRTTEYSGGYGKKFDGNSILLRLPKNRYVFIGDSVYEFTPPEPIVKYYSTVGNSDVPYPVALSKSYAYFMLNAPRDYKDEDKSFILDYIERREFPKGIDWSDAYSAYYEQEFKTKKRLQVKIIHDRLW